jgi:hypothetical protein
MKRIIRTIVFGGATAIMLTAGAASAHDLDASRSAAPPVGERAHLRFARWDRDRFEIRREYAELEGARERFYRERHNRYERERFEHWCAGRRAELDRRWMHEGTRW